MNNCRYIVTLLSIFLYIPLAQAKIAATEWGTFTSLIGSNGVTQDGMYHEDEALPNFVHGFGELVSQPIIAPQPDPDFDDCRQPKVPCRFVRLNRITQKMETPVIYFYAGGTMDVTVDVKFPEGMVTETYPGPTFTTPNHSSNSVVANGHTIFNVTVHDMKDTPALRSRLPVVPVGNIYEHARHVPTASIVQAQNELENFIFYRGVGRFTPKLQIVSNNGGLLLRQCSDCGTIPAAFLVDVDEIGHSQMTTLGPIEEGEVLNISQRTIRRLRNHHSDNKVLLEGAARQALIDGVKAAGLTDDEASAMINTWANGYLRVPGLRLLYVLPRREVDSILPVTITPEPFFTRVFVGRLEVMLDTDELNLLNVVLTARDLTDVARLGRFAESRLRRTQEVYQQREHEALRKPEAEVLTLFERLIKRASTINLN